MNESTEEQLRMANLEIERLKTETETLRARLSTRKAACEYCNKIIEDREKICVYKNRLGKLTKIENFHVICYSQLKQDLKNGVPK